MILINFFFFSETNNNVSNALINEKKLNKQNCDVSLKFMEKNYSKNDTELKLTLQSTRLTVSRCDNGTDQWDTNEFDSKEEHMLVLQDQNFKV